MGEHLQASIPWEKHLAQWIGYKDKQVEQQHGMTQVLRQMRWSHHTQEHRFLSPVLFLPIQCLLLETRKLHVLLEVPHILKVHTQIWDFFG